jgi:hypothetical protein
MTKSLDELLEGAVDWASDFGALVEVNGSLCSLGDAFRGEFKFLVLVSNHTVEPYKSELTL